MERQWKIFCHIWRCSGRALLEFEALCKLLTAVALVPLGSLAMQAIMELSGYAYLTADNLGAFLRSPAAPLLLCLVLLALSLYAVFDIGALLYAIDLGCHGRRPSVQGMVGFGLRAALRALRPRNLPLLPFSLLLLVVPNVGLVLSWSTTIALPEALLEALSQHRPLLLPLLLAGLLLAFWLLRWLYLFPCHLLEARSFPSARRRCLALGRGRRLGALFALLLLQGVAALLFLLAALVLITAAAHLLRLFLPAETLNAALMEAIWLLLRLLPLLLSAVTAPLTHCLISALYYARREEAQAPRSAVLPSLGGWPDPVFRRAEALVLLFSLLCCLLYAFRLSAGYARFSVEYLSPIEVTAHRGASAQCPENTMAAFEAAAELGADWIELDIQQTKDGQIIVMHDASLRRTTGVDRAVWEVTYEEIAELDAGSWFSEAFAGEPVPLLSQVLEFAQERQLRLNIELKPTGHEVNFEQDVVDMIRAYGFADRCVVTSQVYSTLEKVRACGPEIRTVYVMRMAYGDLLRLEAADAFSIQALNITAGMVERIHDAGKEIYAWTVNSRTSLDKMIRLHVDQIITDDILLARERIYSSGASDLIQTYILWLTGG